MWKFLFLLCWGTFWTSGFAVVHAQLSPFLFSPLSLEQGLSQTTVYTILQDKTGFMWIGTGDGLNRFDGYELLYYGEASQNQQALGSNDIRALYEDRAGTMWVGTSGGLCQMDPDRTAFTCFRHADTDPQALLGTEVRTLLEDQKGRLWIGTTLGLNRYVPEGGGFVQYAASPDRPGALPHPMVSSLFEEDDGTLWVGTEGGGLCRLLDEDAGVFDCLQHDPADPASLSDNRVHALAQADDGALWVGTWQGLNLLGPGRQHFSTFALLEDAAADTSTPAGIRALLVDHGGLLWVATEGRGLCRQTDDRTGFTCATHDPDNPSSLGDDVLRALYEDRTGVLWVGTYGDGVSILRDKQAFFTPYRHTAEAPDGLDANRIMSLSEGQDGRLWVGTWGGGVDLVDAATGDFIQHYTAASGLNSTLVRDVAEDQQGRLWVATQGGGLTRIDRATGRMKTYLPDPNRTDGLQSSEIFSVLERRDGSLWVGTWGGGLCRYEPNTDGFVCLRHDPTDPASLPLDQVSVLYESAEGTLWVGTWGGGVCQYDAPTERFACHQQDPSAEAGLSDNRVRAILQDRQGNLWVGTERGLCRFEAPSDVVVCYRSQPNDPNGLRVDQVMALAEDQAGVLWVGTWGGGLYRFDAARDAFVSYVRESGNPNSLVRNSVRALHADADGSLWIGTWGGGLNHLVHKKRERRSPSPEAPVVISSFMKLDERTPLPGLAAAPSPLTLTHQDEVVTFAFAVLDFRAPAQNQYAYRLAGLRDAWIELGTRREVTFTDLPPGRYTLEVRGAGADGRWSTPLSLSMRVVPPFWQTLGFRIGIGLLLLGGLFLAFQWRTKIIRSRNAILLHINDDLNRNIAQRKQAEAERERFVKVLEQKNAELERFTYTVSHDLKSPVVTIKGFAGLIERDLIEGKTDRLLADLSRINTAADQMSRLLDELLEMSRVGHTLNPSQSVPLTPLVQEALALVDGQRAANAVQVSVGEEMPPVCADQLRLREVYQNLLDNAIKFMGAQPAPHIEVGARHDDGMVLSWVRDNGIGIPKPYHEKVFGLFERLDTDTYGTGVGLALVRRIVEAHGGRIWVESEGTGQGATFWFTLPPCANEPVPTK